MCASISASFAFRDGSRPCADRSLRGRQRAPDVLEMVAAGGGARGGEIDFFEADLLADGGWADAVRGCDFVLHVASPFGGRRRRARPS